MPNANWQKSSYCGEGDARLSVTTSTGRTVRLTESGDPSGAILHTTPATWAKFLRDRKESPNHG